MEINIYKIFRKLKVSGTILLFYPNSQITWEKNFNCILYWYINTLHLMSLSFFLLTFLTDLLRPWENKCYCHRMAHWSVYKNSPYGINFFHQNHHHNLKLNIALGSYLQRHTYNKYSWTLYSNVWEKAIIWQAKILASYNIFVFSSLINEPIRTRSQKANYDAKRSCWVYETQNLSALLC